MKYHDENTVASHPGGLVLSPSKLRKLEPALFDEDATFTCSAHCPVHHPAAEMRARYAEHLDVGCCGPAVVMSVRPFVVAAYASDLDGVVLLELDEALAGGLTIGSRLLAVNTFFAQRGRRGEALYPADLLAGPRRAKRWTNFHPLIADFLVDDGAAVARRKQAIDEATWLRCAETARLRIERLSSIRPRSGRPTEAGKPVASRRPSLGTVAAVVVVAVLALLALFVHL